MGSSFRWNDEVALMTRRRGQRDGLGPGLRRDDVFAWVPAFADDVLRRLVLLAPLSVPGLDDDQTQ